MTYDDEMKVIWNALREMQGNIFYIRQELPNVTLSQENRDSLLKVLANFDGTLYDLRTEARNLEDKLGMHPGEPPYDPDIKNPDPRVTIGFLRDWPLEDFQALTEVVQAIDAAGEEVAYLLIAESAVNMINNYRSLSQALSAIEGELPAEKQGAEMDDSGINQNNLGLLMRALTFAADKHRNQRRKGVEQNPYINHPIALADILVNEGGIADIEVICAALLHDVIEDCEVREEDLAAEFGPAIAKLVAEVTDDKSLDKDERKRRQVEKAPTLSHGAALIKLADKIANLRDIRNAPPADWDAERKRKYYDWATEVIDGLRGTHEALEAVFDEACSHGLPRQSPQAVPGGDGEGTTTPQDRQTGKGRKKPLKLSYATEEDPIYSAGSAIGGRRLKPSSKRGPTGSEKDPREILAEQAEEGLRRQGSSSGTADE